MKKSYNKPEMNIVCIQNAGLICTSVTGATTNVDIEYGGGSSQEGRSRSFSNFDDEGED